MFIYKFDKTGALSGPMTFLSIPGFGPHVPGDTVLLPEELPAAQAGYCWVLTKDSPLQVVDKRGTVYRIDTGESMQWDEPGELPEDLTTQPWPGAHHLWLNGTWVLDEAAQSAVKSEQALIRRDGLLQDAQLRIAPLEYAEKLSSATDAERASLEEWMRYCVELNRLESQASFPDSIDWPQMPQLVHRR